MRMRVLPEELKLFDARLPLLLPAVGRIARY